MKASATAGLDNSCSNHRNLWMFFRKSTNRSQKKQPAAAYCERLVKIFTKTLASVIKKRFRYGKLQKRKKRVNIALVLPPNI